MSTRAAQIELLLDPLTNPLTGSLCSGFTAYFYAAGTTTPKNVWTEKEKTNAYTSYALDSGGKILLYGDGIYKIVIKDLDAAAVLTLDNIKIQANNFSVVQKVGAYEATPDDDVILCTGEFTVSFQAVANYVHPITVKNIGTTLNITLDPNGAETIDGSATVTLQPGESRTLFPDATSNVWRASAGLGVAFVNSGLGYCTAGDTITALTVTTTHVASTMETVGPTGSGAANIWTALDSLPNDIDWIEVRINSRMTRTTDPYASFSLTFSARGEGSSASGDYISLAKMEDHGSAAAPKFVSNITCAKIPVANRKFECAWYPSANNTTSQIYLFLTGYGYSLV